MATFGSQSTRGGRGCRSPSFKLWHPRPSVLWHPPPTSYSGYSWSTREWWVPESTFRTYLFGQIVSLFVWTLCNLQLGFLVLAPKYNWTKIQQLITPKKISIPPSTPIFPLAHPISLHLMQHLVLKAIQFLSIILSTKIHYYSFEIDERKTRLE